MKTEFSTLLRNLRTEQDIKQEAVSIALGISVSTYSHYEQGTREPDILTLVRLACYFHVNLTDLLVCFIPEKERDRYWQSLSVSNADMILLNGFHELTLVERQELLTFTKILRNYSTYGQ